MRRTEAFNITPSEFNRNSIRTRQLSLSVPSLEKVLLLQLKLGKWSPDGLTLGAAQVRSIVNSLLKGLAKDK